MTSCFRCGDDDHLSYDCPSHNPPRTTPGAAFGLPPTPPDSNRPEDKPIPVRRPAREIADAHSWAEQIRRQMGWDGHERERMLRARAAQQVAESRASREMA